MKSGLGAGWSATSFGGTMFDDLTWTCHVCGDERPDAIISVHQRHRFLLGDVPVTENIRYCNDRPECQQGALSFTFLKGDT